MGWATVAVVVVVTMSMLTLIPTTTCADAVPGEATSYCTTEPMIGVAGTWVAAVTGVVVLAVCVWQIVRAVRADRVPID
ncbi:hypothetical protein [Curtobacterium flaccumfaciens]|uniref:hypothetical protein n=1 Tax=Curtobacterium flaccumfaciens TaxID=2035 RepID=UPI00217D81DE|nr:hypothetical protein [Curtobacterium flaccumfaciens]MCS6587097.1 hypothetical protein [Curtobacterium flaccumfaciens pv. flaccumfaciens]